MDTLSSSIQAAPDCNGSETCVPVLAPAEELTLRLIVSCLAYNHTYQTYKLLSNWLTPEPLSVYEFPDSGAIYTPLIQSILCQLPTNSVSTAFYQMWSMVAMVLTSIPLETQQRMAKFLQHTSNRDMREQLTQGFDNLATAHFSRYIRARENFSFPDCEQPTVAKNSLSPQLHSRLATLLGKASS